MGAPFRLHRVAVLSEPRLVELREHLEAERAAGAEFPDAWPRARAELLAAVRSSWEREDWERVLVATEPAWRRAYAGARSSSLDHALVALAVHAREPAELRHQPAA
jgi:hypothetical protein